MTAATWEQIVADGIAEIDDRLANDEITPAQHERECLEYLEDMRTEVAFAARGEIRP